MIGGTLFIVSVVVIAIWVIVEVKRVKHKIFALFLIGLIIASYLSAAFVFRGQDINLTSVSGVLTASKIYFSWLGNVFVNVKEITANAIKMDWSSRSDVTEFNITDIGLK